ncbi:hypothetical protein TWF506_001443 [Arthrobotrys conoides]|uniref:Uncharacterized protein n=1 Tax=Arthrobotrys conoides TaxID=74498 RepID=A0AAN8NMR5_9PEZI
MHAPTGGFFEDVVGVVGAIESLKCSIHVPLKPLGCLSGLCHLTEKYVDVVAVDAAATGGAAAAAVGIEDVDEHQSPVGIPSQAL